MRIFIVLVFAASSLLLAGCCTTHPAKQWEYLVVNDVRRGANISDVVSPNVDPELAKLGSEGWELVTYTDNKWVFKRLKK
jgi:hypothetical protein